MLTAFASVAKGSPVSDDGRGLKRPAAAWVAVLAAGSPVSDDGRGLKQRLLKENTDDTKGFARQR